MTAVRILDLENSKNKKQKCTQTDTFNYSATKKRRRPPIAAIAATEQMEAKAAKE